MTKRSAPPAQPDAFAREFVNVALSLIHREGPASTAASALHLCAVLGAGWRLWAVGGGEPQLLAQRATSTQTLADAATQLARACLGRLDVKSKGWLLSRMDGGTDELLPGAQPSHFRIGLDLDHETWTLRLTAHARGSACTVAELGGVIEQVQQAAA